MQGFGDFILTIGTLVFLIGYFPSILSGFRRSKRWGYSLLFIPVFSQFIYYFSFEPREKSWFRFVLLGTGISFIGTIIYDNPVLGIILLVVALAGGGYYLMNNKLEFKIPLTSGTIKRVKPFTVEGIEYDPNRCTSLLSRNKAVLSRWGDSKDQADLQGLFLNPELIADVSQFNRKYFSGMMGGKSPERIDWRDERLELFFELLARKYQLNTITTVTLLLYIFEEESYRQYQNRFEGIDRSSFNNVMEEIVLNDIYSGTKPNFQMISRFLQYQFQEEYPDWQSINESREYKKWLSKVSLTNIMNLFQGHHFWFGDVEGKYQDIKEDIKISQFEKSLAGEIDGEYVRVEEQIKSEKQQERIDKLIRDELAVDPENYIIVERDYSRESRLDNYYKRSFSYVLSRAFDGHCCKCGEGMGQLEFDHFWLPKSQGGNFLMRSKEGLYVNNCIPLCRSCNSSKGYLDFRSFFDEDEIENVVLRSQSINELINRQMINFEDPDFPNRAY